jgi:hypothetical protein
MKGRASRKILGDRHPLTFVSRLFANRLSLKSKRFAMTKTVISLHDQATELRYPENFQRHIELLFGPQTHGPARRPRRVISVQEIGSGRYSISGDTGQRAGDDLSLTELFDALLEQVVHSLIDKLDSAVALHAASIGWGGKCILIPGPTGAGKTSLAGWFVANNFEFLTDELVVLPGTGSMTFSFPRPLLAKLEAEEPIAILARSGRSQTVRTAANVMVCRDSQSPSGEQQRHAGLIIFPHFVSGSELKIESVSPAMTGLKLMECNLNARNLADHGLRTLAAFARETPALTLTYGSYEQLDDVADTLAKFVLETGIPAIALRKLISAFGSQSYSIARGHQVSSKAPSSLSVVSSVAAPDASPRKDAKKLTIGMATYDDYDGVYFTVQAIRLYHPEILDDTELLVVDNHPDGPCAEALKGLEYWIPNYRYVSKGEISGTAIRDWVFHEARGEFVLCIDCHVFIVPGALKRLMDYFDAHPDTKDLLQGPMIYDDLKSYSTHFKPGWQAGMYGTWDVNPAGADPDQPPFEIPMQGLGLFACRRAAWPSFNPAFRGFGGEEGYIHEKFRQRGGRALCLPFLRWMHRFNRPLGTPYANQWEDRVRNYLIGFRELGWDTAQVVEHFKTFLGEETWQEVTELLGEGVLLPDDVQTDVGLAIYEDASEKTSNH